MRRRHRASAALLTFCLAGACAPQVASEASTAIGAAGRLIQIGPVGFEAQAVSADGTVIVGLARGDAAGLLRWREPGQIIILGGLDLGRGLVSSDGLHLAGTGSGPPNQALHWTWQEGQPVPAAEPVSLPDGWRSEVLGLSRNGRFVVGSAAAAQAWPGRAFVWQRYAKSPAMVLSSLAGEASAGEAWAVSDDGRLVVGSAGSERDGMVAARWFDGQGEWLRDAQGRHLGAATACSADGRYIVGRGRELDPTAIQPAYRWSASGGVRWLPVPSQSPARSRFVAHDISADGRVVVGAGYHTDGAGTVRAQGFVWRDNGADGMSWSLQELLPLLQQGHFDEWSWVVPRAVSSDAGFVVGWGFDPSGALRSWRLRLQWPSDVSG